MHIVKLERNPSWRATQKHLVNRLYAVLNSRRIEGSERRSKREIEDEKITSIEEDLNASDLVQRQWGFSRFERISSERLREFYGARNVDQEGIYFLIFLERRN